MEQKINVHWSWFTRIVTILVSLVFARIIWEEFKDFQANSLNRGVLLYVIFFILISVVFAINAPISVRLTPQYFELRKLVGRIRIEYTAITHVVRYKPSFWDMRGFFQGDKIGRYSGFFADKNQAFLIRTKRGKLYVFSTEAPDRTVEELKKRIQ